MDLEFKKVETDLAITQLFDLVQVIWPEVFVPIIGQDQVTYMLEHYQSIEKIKAEIAEGAQYYVMALAGEAIGYLAYEVEAHQLFISKLYLLEEVRGQGLSRQAFDWLEKVAREQEKEKLHLHVNRYNTRAVAVYQHYQFEIVKVIDTPLGEFLLTDYWMDKKL
jgi:GNAT superfamily N-acetyltransferase